MTEEQCERIDRALRKVLHAAFQLRGTADQLAWLEFVMAYDRLRDALGALPRAPAGSR